MKTLATLLIFAAGSVSAQVLTGDEFDALSQGTTMHFSESGQFYGSEQFFSNRRTAWRADDGRCVNGKWTYEPPAICFVYDDGSGPFCWTVEKTGDKLTVTSTNSYDGAPPTVLELAGQDKEPIVCTGPLFGVAFRP